MMPRLTHLAGLELPPTSTSTSSLLSTPPRCSARRESRTGPGASLPAMPPEERFLPRFAAEPPQEALPYGRWQERLREEFLAPPSTSIEAEDLGSRTRYLVSRSHWHGRTYLWRRR